MNIKKEYTNGEVTIIWQPGLCQQAFVPRPFRMCIIRKKNRG